MISSLADTIMLTDKHIGGANGQITRVVVHGTVSPCERGGARANARYFQSPAAGGSAHYVVDPGEIVACVDEDRVAFHAPPNPGSIGVELCDPQQGDPARWNDADHQEMFSRAGRLVADICARRSLPVVYLATADLLAGNWGITGHVNVAQAWHQSDHTDPRDMPIDMFMGFVTPAPSPTENDMIPGPCTTSDGVEHVFGVAGGVIYEDWYDKGPAWQGPGIVGGANITSGVGCHANGLRIDVYAYVGADLYHFYRAAPGQPWLPAGGEKLPGVWR